MTYFNFTDTNSGVSSVVIDTFILNTVQIVNLTCLAEIIGIFGIAANIVNIRVYHKLGYSDGVNVTLTFLAMSDTGALVVQQCYNILVLPVIRDADMVIVKKNVNTMIFYLYEYFIRLSCLITTFASFERCLCVVLPLKVKRLFTTKVTVMTNVSLCIFISAYLIPPYYEMYFDWKFAPILNRTILTIFYRVGADDPFQICYYFTDLLLPYSTFSLLIVCSVISYVKLKSKAKWRLSNSNSGAQTSNSNKERKTGAMVLTISIICISFLLPKAVYFMVLNHISELWTGGPYNNISLIIISFTTLLETTNCSITIFTYFKMSTRYRAEFNKMFHKSF